MNNKLLIAILAVATIVGGVVGAVAVNKLLPMVGGDFAGGVQPAQLFTASASGGAGGNGYVTPVGNLGCFQAARLAPAGSWANNAVTEIYTAVTNYPASSNVVLGPITAATSTATTTVAFTAPGFSVGDACNIGYNGVTSTADAFGADGFVTAVSGNSVSATVTFWNGKNAVTTLTPTSSVTGVSSTLKTTCFHTGV